MVDNAQALSTVSGAAKAIANRRDRGVSDSHQLSNLLLGVDDPELTMKPSQLLSSPIGYYPELQAYKAFKSLEGKVSALLNNQRLWRTEGWRLKVIKPTTNTDNYIR
ncbi:MAG TPA: hypothetical protein V6D14_34880 [Coleofasciculaceae cyanobacterium]